MRSVRPVGVALVIALLTGACDYIVVPPEDDVAASGEDLGWTAVATGVAPGEDGGLRIDLTIRNETGDWSAMAAAADKPATLTPAEGSPIECATVVVGSGGHRVPPGFQLRGFTAGPKTELHMEDVRVECAGVTASPGGRLVIDYGYAIGDYDYYSTDVTQEASLEVDLDQLATDLSYPIAQPVDGLLQPPDVAITAINDVVLTLTGVERVDDLLTLAWHTANSGEYPAYVHIGNPPVIGSDGMLYGYYESPDLASVPVTPPVGEATWTTEVEVPAAVTDLVIPLSVESRKARTFVHYAIDLGGS